MRTYNYICVACGSDMYARPNQIAKTKHGLTCSKECGAKNRANWMTDKGNHQFGVKGKYNSSFTGDRKVSNYGYILIYKPEHIRANHAGYVFEHLLVMQKHLGRALRYFGHKHKNNEVCHHKDRNKQNNVIDNLQLMTDSEHTKLHIKEDRKRALKSGKTQSIFDDVAVTDIRNKYATGKYTQAKIAEEYGVSQSVICNVINKGRYSYGKL